MRPLTTLLRSPPSLHITALLTFLTLYTLLLLHLRRTSSWRDPSSLFFDPARAFERHYSITVESEAQNYITTLNTSTSQSGLRKAGKTPKYCVGIPTVQRSAGARYFSTLVGSLLRDLSAAERESLYLIGFIVNTDPREHLAYSEEWLGRAVDKVLTYTGTEPGFERLVEWEKGGKDPWHKRKPVKDYVRLLEECLAVVGTDGGREGTGKGEAEGGRYVVLLEDDVIARKGWYRAMDSGVRSLERKAVKDWLYLRLFYNERLLGWNGEDWRSYFLSSVGVALGVVGVMLLARKISPLYAGKFLTTRAMAVILFVCTPLCIGLFFAAGRLTVAPLRPGLNRMDRYGCCSQAFLFPREQVPALVESYQKQSDGFIDVFTEEYADGKGLSRWAVTPSPFQHVGLKSSKSESPGRWGKSNTQNIFNWSFEMLGE